MYQKPFDTIKALLARNVLLAYPTYGEIFKIYTDASKQQLSTAIMQNNQPIAIFSRKLSKTQMKYSVTELSYYQ